MLAIGIALTFAAWCLLSLGLPRHHQQALRRPLPARREWTLRAGGWILLAASAVWFVTTQGWEFGPVFWLAALMLTGLAWSLVLTRLGLRASRRAR